MLNVSLSRGSCRLHQKLHVQQQLLLTEQRKPVRHHQRPTGAGLQAHREQLRGDEIALPPRSALRRHRHPPGQRWQECLWRWWVCCRSGVWSSAGFCGVCPSCSCGPAWTHTGVAPSASVRVHTVWAVSLSSLVSCWRDADINCPDRNPAFNSTKTTYQHLKWKFHQHFMLDPHLEVCPAAHFKKVSKSLCL